MARDIEDFLRRAAERRQQQMKQKQGGAPPPAQRPATPPPQQSRPKPKPRPRPVVIRDEVEVVDMRRQSVQEHVKSHIDTSSFAYHAEHLTDDISQTDERIEGRIHQKFDHDVSQLDEKVSVRSGDGPGASKDDVSQIAMDIVNLLRSPTTMRQAILMAEVLRRPNLD